MSNIELFSDSEVEQEDSETPIYDKLKKIEEVGLLRLKGYNKSDIAEVTGLSIPTISRYIKEHESMLQRIVDEDPHFLENIQFNTIRAMAEFDEISKEAWESIEIATREGMITARNGAIKLAMEVAAKKAQLNQLLGTQKTDGEVFEKMQKVEVVNQLLSQVIKDVIADCEHCRIKARPLLEEAFRSMNEHADIVTPQDAADDLDFIDGEVIE